VPCLDATAPTIDSAVITRPGRRTSDLPIRQERNDVCCCGTLTFPSPRRKDCIFGMTRINDELLTSDTRLGCSYQAILSFPGYCEGVTRPDVRSRNVPS
jgi:hypothetical protein